MIKVDYLLLMERKVIVAQERIVTTEYLLSVKIPN
jgi:hypothetical protein